MAKMSKEELISKINGLEIDDTVKIELMEDVTDSFEEVAEPDTTEIDELKTKYEELQTKYKERFLSNTEEKEDEDEEDDGLEEKEVIDVKEI